MNKLVRRDFTKAYKCYKKNEELIKKQFRGKLFNIEMDSKELSIILDKCASTDMFYLNDKGLIYGVALRINFTESWHKNVTIRYKRSNGYRTEYEKTIESFKSNAINSAIGIQLDADEDLAVVSGIIYDRLNLFKIIESNIYYFEKEHLHKVKQDGNLMFYFKNQFFKDNNITHQIF